MRSLDVGIALITMLDKSGLKSSYLLGGITDACQKQFLVFVAHCSDLSESLLLICQLILKNHNRVYPLFQIIFSLCLKLFQGVEPFFSHIHSMLQLGL